MIRLKEHTKETCLILYLFRYYVNYFVCSDYKYVHSNNSRVYSIPAFIVYFQLRCHIVAALAVIPFMETDIAAAIARANLPLEKRKEEVVITKSYTLLCCLLSVIPRKVRLYYDKKFMIARRVNIAPKEVLTEQCFSVRGCSSRGQTLTPCIPLLTINYIR